MIYLIWITCQSAYFLNNAWYGGLMWETFGFRWIAVHRGSLKALKNSNAFVHTYKRENAVYAVGKQPLKSLFSKDKILRSGEKRREEMKCTQTASEGLDQFKDQSYLQCHLLPWLLRR